MSFPCSDPLACGCECHVSWATHVPVCRECRCELRDSDGVVLTEGAQVATCCARTWHVVAHGDAQGWEWKHRDEFDYRDLLPLDEIRELTEHAPVPDLLPEDDR